MVTTMIDKALFISQIFLLMIVIKELIRSGMLKINDFLLACLVISGIVAIDITIQFIFGKNLFGIEPIYPNTETVYFTWNL